MIYEHNDGCMYYYLRYQLGKRHERISNVS